MTNPEISKVDKNLRAALAQGMTSWGAVVQNLYSIQLLEIKNGNLSILENSYELSVGPSSEVGNNTTPSYMFRLPPKVHEMSEPFATNVIGTQEGGKYVESHGSPIKEIRISGTTGLRPHRNASKNLSIFGANTGLSSSSTVGQVAEFAGVANTPDAIGPLSSLFNSTSTWSDKEAIGHDDVMFLRNLFRLYDWHKTNGPNAGRVLMVWRNAKDDDYWVVEPMEFKLAQNSSSPLTYEYSITFKTLQKLELQVYVNTDDTIGLLRSANNFVARTNQASAAIRNSLLVIASQIDRLARAPRDVTSFILMPMRYTLEGLDAVRRSEKRFTSNFVQNLKLLQKNLDTLYKEIAEGYDATEAAMMKIRKAMRTARIEVDKLLSQPELQPSAVITDAKATSDHTLSTYNTPTENKGVYAGTQPLVNNNTQLSQAVVQPNDTIHSLAVRLVGNRSAFKTLIAINNLTAPYVSPAGGVGVLRPGDYILYPSAVQATGSSNSFGAKLNNKETSSPQDIQSNSSLMQQFGRDLRLITSQQSSYEVKFDLTVDQSGDISTLTGIPNIAQAVRSKFSTVKGELPAHPSFGASFPMGARATPTTLAGFRIDVEQTLLSDIRISNIKNLSFTVIGDILSAKASINLVNSANTVTLSFPLRSVE